MVRQLFNRGKDKMKIAQTLVAIVTKVSNKAIPLFNNHCERISFVKDELKQLENDKETLAGQLLSKYTEPGIYLDKNSNESIEIGFRKSTSKGYKDALNTIKGYISFELKIDEKTRKILLSKIESVTAEFIGVETKKPNVCPYIEEEKEES